MAATAAPERIIVDNEEALTVEKLEAVKEMMKKAGGSDAVIASGIISEPPPSAMTAMNGSVFAIGELVPLKGVYFKLVDLNTNGEITLQSVGLTKKCVKRILGRKS